ncbi:deoxyribodipyrimidine photolyase [Maribacter sp.]|nr:deoxyribodipyrimidine photolyase [Maribacter sp.]
MVPKDTVRQPHFPSTYTEILCRVDTIDPLNYGRTRNFVDGAVSYLSPYISRGILSTKFVFQHLLDKGYQVRAIEKFIQELAWRDYWQQVWIAKGNAIDSDLRHSQPEVRNEEMPRAVFEGKTGIQAIDSAIKDFYRTGYMHNHLRMYVASIACNLGKSHWKIPAQWMYYHLLDADWASNALSWQWVAGANSNKKYVANQENINTYCYTAQSNTFLDIPYEALPTIQIPNLLIDTLVPELLTPLPEKKKITIDSKLPTLLYSFYNLDPLWKADVAVNRILLLEPSHFIKYPIGQKSMDFMLDLSQNIKKIQVYVGEFDELITEYTNIDVYFKEHPSNMHYKGNQEPRDWMFNVTGYYPSFFAFWKKCKKELIY